MLSAAVRPRLCLVKPSSARPLSLWPASSSSPSPPSTLAPAPAAPLDHDQLLPAELMTPVLDALPSPSIFEPLSEVFLSLPPTLGVASAVLIPALTIVLRTTLTLPITLWQRRRTRRFENVVMPLLRKLQGDLSFQVRAESRRAGKSFEEYQAAYKKRAKAEGNKLAAKHSATPLVTLLVPPLIHIPIFISTTLILRDACTRALTSLSSPPDSSALTSLHTFATDSLLWCPSVVLPDPSLALPLLVGAVALLNVEVSAKNRKAIADAARGYEAVQTSAVGGGMQAPGSLSASAKKRLETKLSRQATSSGPPVGKRRFSSTGTELASIPKTSTTPGQPEENVEPRTATVTTALLRLFSVAFIPIAAFSPSAVCAYWLTSNLYTLIQNSIFAVMDRRRERHRLLNATATSSSSSS